MSDAVTDPGSNAGGVIPWIFKSASKLVLRTGTVVGGLGVVVAALLYFKQDSLLYFPEVGGLPRRPSQNPRRYRSPSEHQIPYREESVVCDDGVNIHAWLLLRSDNSKRSVPTIVFFHGNAGNIGLRLPNAMQMLQYLDANVFMVEYRGYGDSDTVTPTEAGLKLDAEAALRHIVDHPSVDASKIFLFGRSLGGAVAFHLAQYAQHHNIPLAGVIVENTFLSISKMVDHLMPYLAPFKALVLRIGWHSERIVPTLQTPVLYLAGTRDQLVPHSHMLELWKSTKASRLLRLHVVPGGTHNETWMKGKQPYWDAIRSFLKDAVALSDACANDSTSTATTATDDTSKLTSQQHHTKSNGKYDPSLVHRKFSVTPQADSDKAKKDDSSTAIPTMPSDIMGMAREVMRETSTTGIDVDKKDM